MELVNGTEAMNSLKSEGALKFEVNGEEVSLAEEEAKATLLHAAEQQMDQSRCPRCGALIENPHTRALSRQLNIKVCESCGTAEALEDFLVYQRKGTRKPFMEWAALQPEWWGGESR